MIIDEFKESEKNTISQDLVNVIDYINNELIELLPTTVLDNNYFVYACLCHKHNLLFYRLRNSITNMAIETITESYGQYISSRSPLAIKPGRKVQVSNDFLQLYNNAKTILTSDELNGKYSLVTSDIVLLGILSDFSDENKLRKVFNKAGVAFSSIKAKMVESPLMEAPEIDIQSAQPVNIQQIQELQNAGANVVIMRSGDAIPQQLMNSLAGKQEKRGDNKGFISRFCIDLNTLVEQDKIQELIGRENEINSIIRVLGRKKKNNAILVGGEGVGKTAICEGLAYLIVNKRVPYFLFNKVVISLDMTSLMAGTTLRGMFEERVKGVLDEIKASGKYILFIDNIGAALGSNDGKNEYDIASMLSHALENGDCQVIGASDFKQYRKTFDKDKTLGRRFQKIIIEKPSIEDSINVLNGIKKSYEEFHHVKYTPEAIIKCVKLSDKYITDRNLPDSAIDIMDEVGALYGTVSDNETVRSLLSAMKSIDERLSNKANFECYGDFDDLQKYRTKLNGELKAAIKKDNEQKKEKPFVITESEILQLISEKTNIPLTQLTSNEANEFLKINDRLKADVIGQDNAIDTICKALKRNRVGLNKTGCQYSAILIGKTGTGKTYLAKKLAKELFGSEKQLVRFDMSEYPDKTSVNKLIGSNPGYIGYEDGGLLTETIKNKKHCVLLLDEIEKADPEVYNIFLQVLDEGFLTDNSGQRVDFSNVVILFTSNVGAKTASDFKKGIGFNEDENKNEERILKKSLTNRFPPEFLNRIDNIVYFNALTNDNMREIVKIELNNLVNRLYDIGYTMKYDNTVVDFILENINDGDDFGARPIKRAIQDNIEDKITDLILEKKITVNDCFSCVYNGTTIECQTKKASI